MNLTNKEEWWQALNENWDQLIGILYQFIPMSQYIDYRQNMTDKPMGQIIENLKQNQDSEIVRYLNAAWASAPDHISIHKIPCWGLLCDLCSEEWCLHEENQ